MVTNLNSKQNVIDINKKDQSIESFSSDRKESLVELSRFGDEYFISRSQAKRISRNLHKFTRVTLDFKGVKMVGQGFVDELFRVYLSHHLEIKMNYVNANDDVEFMIKRCLATEKLANKGDH